MSCGAGPHPLCDRQPEAHSDRGVLQGGPGLSDGQTTKGSRLGRAAPPRPSLASLQSLRRAPAPGPVALSEQPAIGENREHPVPKHSRKTDTPWGSEAEGSQIIVIWIWGGGEAFFPPFMPRHSRGDRGRWEAQGGRNQAASASPCIQQLEWAGGGVV